MFEELKNIKLSRKDYRSFGITFGIIFFITSAFFFYYDIEVFRLFGVIASAFIVLGLIFPILLKPLYVIWMTFAVILGWFMTRIILILLFYFVVTPIALLTKIFGEDFLALKKIKTKSYWNIRNSDDEKSQNYGKQF